MQDKTDAVRAGFGPRAAAFLIDRGILVLALLLVRVPAWITNLSTGRGGMTVLFDFTVLDILCYGLMSVYFILLTHFTGSTLGKKVMGLHVEKEDGEKPSLIDVIYRETIGRYLSGILYLGYLMVLADSRKRAFHDYICDTRVIYDEKVLSPRPKAKAEVNSDYTVPGGDIPAYTIPSLTPTEEDKTEE